MNKRKILTLALSICMIAILAIGGSLAYLTDKDNETNVFTVGNVDIDLIESQYYPQVDIDKTLDDVVADSKTYNAEGGYLDVNGENMVPGRWVRKAPYVINTGKNAAYVRIRVEFSADIDEVTEIMFNSTEITNNEEIIMETGTKEDGTVWGVFTFVDPIQPSTVDGTESDNMTTFAPIWQFKIKDDLDNAELAKVQNVQNSIMVYAEAIQAEGFDDYKEAFAAYDAQMAAKQPADDETNG